MFDGIAARIREYEDARRFIDLAATSRLPGDCAALQKATLRNALAAHSSSAKDAEAWLRDGRALTHSLLRRDSLELRGVQDPANDPYVYCLLSSFYLETLYEAEWREAARDHYELAVKAWPRLTTCGRARLSRIRVCFSFGI